MAEERKSYQKKSLGLLQTALTTLKEGGEKEHRSTPFVPAGEGRRTGILGGGK